MYRYPDNFIKLYEKSFRTHAELPALSLYGRPGAKSYLHLAANIARTHILFREMGLQRGDKIAMYAKDSDVWIEAFMSVITYGATVVPVLPDFTPEDATNIINHSGAKLLLASDALWKRMDFKKLKQVDCVLSLDTPKLLEAKDNKKIQKLLDIIGDLFAQAYPQGFTAEDIHYPQVDNNSVIVLNYTSGTTGFSKGVMLTGWNLAGNIIFGLDQRLHYARSRVLSFLPLAHAFGCAFDLLLPMAAGSHVTVLGRTPTPSVLLKALARVKSTPERTISIRKNLPETDRTHTLHAKDATVALYTGCKTNRIPNTPQQTPECIRRKYKPSSHWRSCNGERHRRIPAHDQISVHSRLRHDRMRTSHQLYICPRIHPDISRTYPAKNNGIQS